MEIDRRWFMLAGFGTALIAATRGFAGGAEKKSEAEEEISAPEDLMREHGYSTASCSFTKRASGGYEPRATSPLMYFRNPRW